MSDTSSRTTAASVPSSENQSENMENLKKDKTEVSNDVSESYPSTQKRILIMVALYLAMFLVTLV